MEVEGVEELHGVVRVHRGDDLRDGSEVPVQELAETAAVVDGARAGAARYEELEAWDAERVLHVHDDEAEAKAILGRGPEAVKARPALRSDGPLLVGDAPDVGDGAGVEVRRDGQLAVLHDRHFRKPGKFSTSGRELQVH